MSERLQKPFPRARKRFGQHFLEPAWVTRLVNAVDPQPDDTFLEIGPGRGALTKVIAPRVKQVIAVEIDRDLAAALPALVPPNVQVIEGDFLETDLEKGFVRVRVDRGHQLRHPGGFEKVLAEALARSHSSSSSSGPSVSPRQ